MSNQRTQPGLGTLLRHLTELLDADVERVYRRAGLRYRARFTPVMRALADASARSIGDIAEAGGTTHSAASQTVARMAAMGLVALAPASDRRRRAVRLTARGRALLPALRAHWAATTAAAQALDEELPAPLAEVLSAAIAALERRSFFQRIEAARPRVVGDREVRRAP